MEENRNEREMPVDENVESQSEEVSNESAQAPVEEKKPKISKKLIAIISAVAVGVVALTVALILILGGSGDNGTGAAGGSGNGSDGGSSDGSEGGTAAHTCVAGEPIRENVTEATCIGEGSYDEVTYCTECGKETSRNAKSVQATGVHSPAAPVEENRVEPTTESEGSCESVVYCSVCETEISRESITIPKLCPHGSYNAVNENEVAPTCSAEGSYDEVTYCTLCGEEVERTTNSVDKIPHTAGDAVRENEIAAGCTSDGSYDRVVYCTVCSAEMSRENISVPAQHSYEDGVCTVCGKKAMSEGLEYTLSDDSTYYIVSGRGTCTDKDIIIPAEHEGLPVKEIGYAAFNSDNKDITSVVIPDSITAMGRYAFSGFESLSSVTIGNGLTYISDYAFMSCNSLRAVDIPATVTSMGERAFLYCRGLESIVLHEDIASIGAHAFDGCYNLVSVTVENHDMTIGDRAFMNCYRLVEIIAETDYVEWGSSYGGIGLYAFEVHDGPSRIVNVDDYLFYTFEGTNYLVEYIGGATELVLPESYNGEGYEINAYAFAYDQTFTSVSIPDGAVKIGNYAFKYCSNLETVDIGDGVETVGGRAFESCSKLDNVTVGASVKLINGNAFDNCPLRNVKFDVTEGWWYGTTVNSTGGTKISAWVFDDPETLEEYLDDYGYHHWYRM